MMSLLTVGPATYQECSCHLKQGRNDSIERLSIPPPLHILLHYYVKYVCKGWYSEQFYADIPTLFAYCTSMQHSPIIVEYA